MNEMPAPAVRKQASIQCVKLSASALAASCWSSLRQPQIHINRMSAHARARARLRVNYESGSQCAHSSGVGVCARDCRVRVKRSMLATCSGEQPSNNHRLYEENARDLCMCTATHIREILHNVLAYAACECASVRGCTCNFVLSRVCRV